MVPRGEGFKLYKNISQSRTTKFKAEIMTFRSPLDHRRVLELDSETIYDDHIDQNVPKHSLH